jgi:hypothetical protein
VRRVLVPEREEPGEGEWNIVAAGTVINPVLPGKGLANVTGKEARAFLSILLISYARAAEGKSVPRLSLQMARSGYV